MQLIMVLIDTISMVLAVILVKTLKMLESLNLKGFNADVIEYVGDFVKPINKPLYSVYKTLKRLKRFN